MKQPTSPQDKLRTRIEGVDPIGFAEEAADILRSAWRPPCIAYPADYIRFQCGFPTPFAPFAFAAWKGERAVAFVAAVGRKSSVGEIYVSSFLSLRPGTVASVSVAILRAQIRASRHLNRPVLFFAQRASAGEYLLGAIETLGLTKTLIGEYREHSAVPGPIPDGIQVSELPPDDWGRETERFRRSSLLSPVFDPETLAHFQRDPLGRRFLCARRGDEILATAMAAKTPIVTATGKSWIPVLQYVRLSRQQPEPLAALVAAAADPAVPVVAVSNPSSLDPAVVKAGLRATGTSFSVYICANGCELPPLTGTEFENV